MFDQGLSRLRVMLPNSKPWAFQTFNAYASTKGICRTVPPLAPTASLLCGDSCIVKSNMRTSRHWEHLDMSQACSLKHTWTQSTNNFFTVPTLPAGMDPFVTSSITRHPFFNFKICFTVVTFISNVRSPVAV
jgi:hypothetical protein